MSDLLPAIQNTAAGPKAATIDGNSAQAQPIPDLIAADRYQKAAARNRGLPFRSVKLRPGSNADLSRHFE
jgi:hypothetical protein